MSYKYNYALEKQLDAILVNETNTPHTSINSYRLPLKGNSTGQLNKSIKNILLSFV